MAKRERNHVMSLRLSDKENLILEEKCKLSNYNNKSDFIRDMIIYGMVYEVDYSVVRDYSVLLGKIGTNINQSAHKVNETGSIFQSDINDLKKGMDEVWQLQKSMLSKLPYRKR